MASPNIKSLLFGFVAALKVDSTQLYGASLIHMRGTGKGPKRIKTSYIGMARTDVCTTKRGPKLR
jgi:hypothetical protein